MLLPDALASLAPDIAVPAARQRGIFTADQARAGGYSSREIQRQKQRRDEGRWRSVRRGIYAVQAWYDALPAADRHRTGAMALRLALSRPAVFSHVTAALEHGLEMLDPDLDLLHVTRGDLDGARVEAGVVHHAAELPTDHVVTGPDGLELTSLARTAVDYARASVRLESAVALCDSALRAGLTRPELIEMQIRCRNWQGARMASRAVELADARAANPGESWSRVVLASHGHRPTGLQVPFYDDQGLVGYTDFAWEDDRTVGEFDGRLKYAVPSGASPTLAGQVLWQEKRREDRLRALGLTVVRWGYADLSRPERFIERVSAGRALGRTLARRTS